MKVEKYKLVWSFYILLNIKRARKICKYYEIDLSKMYSSAL